MAMSMLKRRPPPLSTKPIVCRSRPGKALDKFDMQTNVDTSRRKKSIVKETRTLLKWGMII